MSDISVYNPMLCGRYLLHDLNVDLFSNVGEGSVPAINNVLVVIVPTSGHVPRLRLIRKPVVSCLQDMPAGERIHVEKAMQSELRSSALNDILVSTSAWDGADRILHYAAVVRWLSEAYPSPDVERIAQQYIINAIAAVKRCTFNDFPLLKTRMLLYRTALAGPMLVTSCRGERREEAIWLYIELLVASLDMILNHADRLKTADLLLGSDILTGLCIADDEELTERVAGPHMEQLFRRLLDRAEWQSWSRSVLGWLITYQKHMQVMCPSARKLAYTIFVKHDILAHKSEPDVWWSRVDAVKPVEVSKTGVTIDSKPMTNLEYNMATAYMKAMWEAT